MALTSDEADLVRSSFRIVSRTSQQSAERFYEILFAMAPETRDLFVNDMVQQGAELMSKLGLIVAELQNLAGMRPILEDLALRHVAYGVKPHHYALVGSALLQMLDEVVGDDFTPETRDAWAKAYGDLSDLMIRSAYAHESPPVSS
ncbi:MAG: globin domain-containing protein [Kiloniellaceae bacterium]